MMCPLFKSECEVRNCAWGVRTRRKVEGTLIEENACVVVALSRELAARNDGKQPRTEKV